MVVETFNPYSIEGHYGMDLVCRLLHERRPESVAIYADDPEVTLAAVRRLGWVSGCVQVQHASHAEAVKRTLRVDVELAGEDRAADSAIVAYSWEQFPVPPRADRVVVLSHNRYSYRLITGKKVDGPSYRAARAWLQQTHDLTFSQGMFAPGFLGIWGTSLLAGDRRSDVHFRLGQLAMDRLYTRSPLRQLAYVTVLAGDRREVA